MKRILILVSLLLVLGLSAYIWYKASWWENMVTSDTEGWYKYPELSRTDIRDTYDLAFKKILLLNGVFFASVFLLLKLGNHKRK
ncbi:MAG: hypothetical protein UX31_C0006G0015 [Candidatus Nomurabacteria bacterium GW2011_GWA1_46_11]|uniref:DUF5671 domain-containing protein n=2 Tax=Parcubacteria group TaxID=1794811 RepID=A0A1G1YX69_9BACT|nr:MAG: hypothetical protein UX29_C0004G0025 [Parcubacteria group bacterium GW2011_GWA2_46_10]KKU22103.1 MAG: hypothetical protein UX31_C0006G0015 [Candidatus Nomurabacteria bacterium GW2011_GWA1_46_11]OGY56366.1 MAG: hypothetical protein A2119_02480 [Candidatus Colwellbacteria bacterium GWA2_46_10]